MQNASGDVDTAEAEKVIERLEKLLGETHVVLEQLPAKSSHQLLIEKVEALRKLSVHRYLYFDQELFSDAAWAMLLALFHGHLRDRPMNASAVCVASGVGVSTALRWLATLTARDIVTRHGDEGLDGLVRLSGHSLAAMYELFGVRIDRGVMES